MAKIILGCDVVVGGCRRRAASLDASAFLAGVEVGIGAIAAE